MKSKEHIINIAVAKATLPELVERAAAGERIILARNGKPRALLSPLAGKKKYVEGAGRGKWKNIEKILSTPLPDDLAEAFGSARLKK